MGGQSGVINQAMQAVNQQQPQQPQYGQQQPMNGGLAYQAAQAINQQQPQINQPQPMNGNGIIAQAYNQTLGQQSLGGMNGPLGGMPQNGINPFMGGMSSPLGATPYNSGTPSYSIGGQTLGGAIGSTPYSGANPQMPSNLSPNMGLQIPTDYTNTTTSSMMNNNNSSSMPMSQSIGNLRSLGQMASQVNPYTFNGQPVNPVGQMTNNVNQQPPQSSPMQQPMMASQQGMMPQRANPYQQRMDRYQQRMDRYEQSGRQIPQNLQRGYDEMKQRQQNPQMNEQRRLAKALRGD